MVEVAGIDYILYINVHFVFDGIIHKAFSVSQLLILPSSSLQSTIHSLNSIGTTDIDLH